MTPWAETIQFPRPLRGATCSGPADLQICELPARNSNSQQSYDEGRIEGEKALGEQLMKQRAELHELINGVVKSLRDSVPQVIRDTESMVVSLALEIAQKLVGEIPISVPMLESVVRNALSEAEVTSQMTIRLHPADLELLQNAGSPLLDPGNMSNDIRFLSSPEVTRGGCMVQTRFGTVDARRETKFDLLKRSLG